MWSEYENAFSYSFPSIVMKNQKGVALIVALLVSLIVIAVLLGTVAFVLKKFGLVHNIEDSAKAFSMASSGLEEILDHHNNKPSGATSGICNASANWLPGRSNFTATGSDCNVATCTNCRVSYKINNGGNENTVFAEVHCDPSIVDAFSVAKLSNSITRSIETDNRGGVFSSKPSNNSSPILKPCPAIEL